MPLQPESSESSDSPLVLTNRQRMLAPLVSLGICVLIFGPVLFLAPIDLEKPGGYALGFTAFLLVFGWLGLAGIRAPFEMRLDDDLTIRSLSRRWVMGAADVRRWHFVHPDGRIDQSMPTDNALLMIRTREGVRFRSEVTREEAERVVRWFARRALA